MSKFKYIFECSKCEHKARIARENTHKLLDEKCPGCGREQWKYWRLMNADSVSLGKIKDTDSADHIPDTRKIEDK